jgi:hypothetical protein
MKTARQLPRESSFHPDRPWRNERIALRLVPIETRRVIEGRDQCRQRKCGRYELCEKKASLGRLSPEQSQE